MAGGEGPVINRTSNHYVEEGLSDEIIENNGQDGSVFDYTDVFNNGKVKLFIPKIEPDTEDENVTKFKGLCVQLQAAVVNNWVALKCIIDNKSQQY